MDVSIIVATYGSDRYLLSGNDTAEFADSHGVPMVRVHGGNTLAESRNAAADLARTEWLCFLDAGDTLAPGYFDAMERATGDLRAPRLQFYDNGTTTEPFNLPSRNIDVGNPCPIGTLIRHSMFEDVGGFWEEPAYEDWSLFRRAWLLGAKIEHVNAIYTAVLDPHGRNSTVENPRRLIKDIRRSHKLWRHNI